MRSRVNFLPLFVIVLAIAFVVAVAMRARTYAGAKAVGTPARAGAAITPAADGSSGPETGTVMPVSAGEANASPNAGASTTTAPERSRAQRLRELLSQPLGGSPTPPPAPTVMVPQKTAPPHPPPQPPPAKPSMLQQLAQKAASAIGLGGSNSQPPNNGSHSSRGDDAPHQPKDPNDPTSDTTPPQLQAAIFDPPQVHDNENASIYITATDDISGIRGISGTLSSPSGKALQGFSCQKDPEVPNRYIGHPHLPEKAEEGIWRVNFITLSDNASNTINLFQSSGGVPQTAVVRVISSQSDSTPPTLRRVSIDHPTMNAGERNTVYIEADDDNSGVHYASGVFLSPSKAARVSFNCQKSDADPTWTCQVNTPTTLDCGNWQLEQVQLQDGANNMATIRSDNPLVAQVKVSILGNSCDSTPPVLHSVTVDPKVTTNQNGSVTVTASVTDDSAGVSSVMIQATGPGQGSGQWTPLNPVPNSPGLFSGPFNIPPSAGKGHWKISFVQVIDRGNNTRVYPDRDPVVVGATFDVR